MAKGLPDWTLETKPNLGKPYNEHVVRVHPGIETYTLIDILGKGVILGGTLTHGSLAAGHYDCQIEMRVDNQQIFSVNIYTFLINNWANSDTMPLYLVKYDHINSLYNFSFSRGWTFAERIVINFSETVGAATTSVRLNYSLFV